MSLPLVCLPPSAAVPAEVPHGEVSWKSAGDSYSSGEGVFGNVGDCAQSDLAYGPLAVQRLGESGWDINSTFTACTGHLVEDYFNPRSDSGGKDSLWDWGIDQGGPQRLDVITMSFGGNDIGFASVITECLLGRPDSWGEFLAGGLASTLTGCDISEEELKARVDALLDPPRSDCTGFRRTGEAGYDCTLDIGDRRGSIIDFYYDVVTKRLSEHGQLYIVGYPRLIAPVDQWPGWVKTSCQGVLRGDSEKLGRVSEHLNDKLHEAVDRVNQALGEERVHFLDRLALFRDGKHELCGTDTDWLNGVAVDRGEGVGVRVETSFHPNADGHSGTADTLVDLVSSTFNQRLYTDVTEFATGPTEVIVLNPFTADGALKPGYTLDDLTTQTPVLCFGPSSSAVTGGTHFCGSTADSTHSCWASPRYPGQVACMTTPWRTELLLRRAENLTPNDAPDDPWPLGIELADGTRWWLRHGGSWGTAADGRAGAYGCDSDSTCAYERTGVELAVVDIGDAPVIDKSTPTWTVLVGELGSPLEEKPPPTRMAVTKAWFIASDFD